MLIVVGILVAVNLQKSRLGRAWMAIREDELAARHMGINTTAAKLSAFALGASFSGVAGVAYAAKLSLVSPDQFQFNVSVLVLSMLVLGAWATLRASSSAVSCSRSSTVFCFLSRRIWRIPSASSTSISRITVSCSTASSSSR
jgi:ABC-type branched-subunit amino acid transport system permease subunit